MNFGIIAINVGGTIGALYGFNYGYYKSKHENFGWNLVNTMDGIVYYSGFGFICGLFWQFSIPVLIMRIYDRKQFDLSIFNAIPKAKDE